MSDETPGSNNPFDYLLNDLMRTLASNNVKASDFIAQFSLLPVSEPQYESNVDPLQRVKYEQLFEVAKLHLVNTDLLASTSVSSLKLELVNPRGLVDVLMKQWNTYISILAETLGMSSSPMPMPQNLGIESPIAMVVGQLGNAMSPMISGAQIGSVLGHYCKDAMRALELSIPMNSTDKTILVPYSVSKFAKEWNLDLDQVMLWTLVQEMTTALVLGIKEFRDHFDVQIRLHLADMRADVNAMMDKLREINPTDPEALQAIFADPTELVGSEMTEAQRINYANIEVTLVVIETTLNIVSRRIATALFGEFYLIEEASRRRRIDGSQPELLLGRMFGIDISSRVIELASEFANYISERECQEDLAKALLQPEYLPTPEELEDFELWRIRVEA
ncbi:putative hydrolase [Ferrithrix thermotolerans DSM 19514]|jgi:putative hydrolase|uniref:Putative hydrolase n=1 Tax=Ferrithrix thermotolerans DSM 19514 TaxID=1121881 RepID=A0A1M4SXR5_9ACTN|nr:zinc-dependent metalloprotease [Ferrithrix thermotolerans]SHE36980.1 putative hydrolase [Ferrithrix thermotolerans DSM 19514]